MKIGLLKQNKVSRCGCQLQNKVSRCLCVSIGRNNSLKNEDSKSVIMILFGLKICIRENISNNL